MAEAAFVLVVLLALVGPLVLYWFVRAEHDWREEERGRREPPRPRKER